MNTYMHALLAGSAVVHLAATPDEADFESQLLGPNIVGVSNAKAKHEKQRLRKKLNPNYPI
jgi:hypothetical protein